MGARAEAARERGGAAGLRVRSEWPSLGEAGLSNSEWEKCSVEVKIGGAGAVHMYEEGLPPQIHHVTSSYFPHRV